MPKIIENLPHRLAEEARRQVLTAGYSAMTIRSVAKECGVGTGTVYNYFPSKDALVAAFMLEDWKKCMEQVVACADASEDVSLVLHCIYDNLVLFLRQYAPVIQDSEAATGFSGSFSRYHGVLRGQLAAPLKKFCSEDFTAEFVAESMLVWTVSGTDYGKIFNQVIKLF